MGMILELLGEIGEGCSIGIGLIAFFAVLVRLFSRKKINPKVIVAVIGGFFGFCIGIYLGELISETWAVIVGVILSPLGAAVGIGLVS